VRHDIVRNEILAMPHDRLRRVAHPTSFVASLGATIAFWLSILNPWHTVADEAATSEPKPARTHAALHIAVEKNLSVCRDWLAAKDWKSLRQTADGLVILAQVLGLQGDDEAWHRAADGVANNVRALQSAADEKQPERCQELIGSIGAQNRAWAKLAPKSKPKAGGPKLEKLPSLRPLMHLMEATHAEAKAAVAVGDLTEAKSMAVVLSELGRVVSNQRADARWRASGESLVRAAFEAADERQSDAKAIRQQLRGVYEKCAACHKQQR
jgi:hypothetical protein